MEVPEKMTIDEYIDWLRQTADVDYAYPKSVRKYNRAIVKASEYWRDRNPDWCDGEYDAFAALIHHEDPLVRASVVVAIIVKVKLTETALNDFLRVLDSAVPFIRGDRHVDFMLWISLWKTGTINTQTPYNGYVFTCDSRKRKGL